MADLELLEKIINGMSPSVLRDIELEVAEPLNNCGLYFRLFTRLKGGASARKKIESKNYEALGKKMQDIIGVRIVLYFKEDIEICETLMRGKFTVLDLSKNDEKDSDFCPRRLNYVCRLDDNLSAQLDSRLWNYPIDQSFEIQIRTVFSEGWHEVEHDLRYKVKNEWEGHVEESKILNGILATLENCDWAIGSLFDDIAYRHYKSKQYAPMIKNKFRIKLRSDKFSNEIEKVFINDEKFFKDLFRIDRSEFLLNLTKYLKTIPLNIDTLVYAANIWFIHNKQVLDLTPQYIKDSCNFTGLQ